ncbi:MAG: hypothetical protein AAGD32_02250 [Planctomycetota bacterium]
MERSVGVNFSLRGAIADGLHAGRANLRPGLLLWCFALAIALGYYFVSPVHDGLERVADLKRQYGFVFSGISTAVLAAVVPLLLGRAFGILRLPDAWGWFVLVTFWAYRGMEVDGFYQLQAWVFGDTNAAPVVATKIAVDQFGYSVFWAVPTMVLAYRIRDRQAWPRPGQWRQWYLDEVLPKTIANWMIWVPALAAIYALPSALQLPMSNIVNCLWVLIFSFMTARTDTDPRGEPVEHAGADQTRS